MNKEYENMIKEALWIAMQVNASQWTCREGYRIFEVPYCPGYTKLIIVKDIKERRD